MTETNPLIHQAHLLDFAAIRAEHVSPALDVLLKDAADALKKATDPATAADWQHVIDPLDAALEKLSRAWGAVGHLMGVMDSPELTSISRKTKRSTASTRRLLRARATQRYPHRKSACLSTRCGTSVCRAPTFPQTKRQN